MSGTGLLSQEFVVLNVIFLLASAVMALFFQLHIHLEALGVGAAWFGFIIAADSFATFFLQPFLSPLLNERNSRRCMAVGVVGMAASLLLYRYALSAAPLIALRVFQGAAFVCLIAGMMTLMVNFVPPAMSGRAFGLVSVVRLVPYAIVPPVLSRLVTSSDSFFNTLSVGAAAMVLCLGLLTLLRKPVGAFGARAKSITWREIREDLTDRRMLLLLTVTLLLYSSYTIVFFYLRGYGQARSIANPGLFFTLATIVMIAVRFAGAPFFDRKDKAATTALSLALLGLSSIILAHLSDPLPFYCLAVLFGLGWGAAMPLLNALVFDYSAPAFRGLNINLVMVMMQGGFFIGPFLGGFALGLWGYAFLFYLAALFCLLSCGLLYGMLKRRPNSQRGASPDG